MYFKKLSLTVGDSRVLRRAEAASRCCIRNFSNSFCLFANLASVTASFLLSSFGNGRNTRRFRVGDSRSLFPKYPFL